MIILTYYTYYTIILTITYYMIISSDIGPARPWSGGGSLSCARRAIVIVYYSIIVYVYIYIYIYMLY